MTTSPDASATESPRHHQESVVVAASPEAVYDLVSDVTRTGEWSPVCQECTWDDPAAAGEVGAWFSGRNVTPQRTWTTTSQVVVASRGREFAWLVGKGFVRWGFELEPVDGGTRLTEVWDFLPAGLAFFAEKYGEEAPAEIEERTQAALSGIPATLSAIKSIAEKQS